MLSWSELALVDRIDREHATDLFSEWPWSPSAVLEVRRCACGELVTKVIQPGEGAPQISCGHQPKISEMESATAAHVIQLPLAQGVHRPRSQSSASSRTRNTARRAFR